MMLSFEVFKNILSERKKLKCWNWKLRLCWWMLFYRSMAPQKLTKPQLKVFLRKSLNFKTKLDNFWTLIIKKKLVSYKVELWVDGGEAATDLIEPQVFKMFLFFVNDDR